MNADIQAKLDAIKAPFQSIIEATDAVPALVDAYAKEVGDARFVEGQNSIVLPTPGTGEKLYTQEDADKLVESVKAEKDAEAAQLLSDKDAADKVIIDGKDAQIVDLQAKLSADPDRGALDVVTQQRDALQVQVASLQADLAAKDQTLAAFKQAELDKLVALEGDFKA